MALYLGSSEKLRFNLVEESLKATTYSYNGVELPALPEWDRKKYPYVVMQSVSKAFRFFSNPSIWESGGLYYVGIQDGDECLMAKIKYTDGQWSEFTEEEVSSFGWIVGLCTWSNFDIVYNGDILLAGSEPEPVPVPIVYSYNDVQLPPLPEWDRVKYPYAFIYGHPVNRDFSVLKATASPLHLEFTREYMESHSVSTPLTLPESGTAVECISYVTTKDGVKVPGQEADEFTFSSETALPNGLRITLPVVWSNYDFCYSDGEVYCAASDPTPVYETVFSSVKVDNSRLLYIKKPEPVAYLYGEEQVRLPALPEEIKAYPYIIIHYIGEDATGTRLAYGYKTKPYTWQETNAFGKTSIRHGTENGVYRGASNYSTVPETWSVSDESEGKVYTSLGAIVWANYDVLNADGTLFMAASEPIPVYE